MKLSWPKMTAAAVGLFGLNLWVAGRLLGIEWLAQMGSIEGARIAQTRWILENWRDLSWFPLWYNGIPMENVYPPLFPAAAALLAAAGGFTAAHAYHICCALAYALGPAAVFLLATRLTGGWAWGFLSGLFYSLISASAWWMPALARDMGSVWGPRRLQNLVVYGEGPHLAALALLPAVWVVVMIAWDRGKPLWWPAAAAGGAAVLCTNWLGGAEWLLLLGAWTVSRSQPFDIRSWRRAGLYAAGSYGLAAMWIPPSTVFAFGGSEEFRQAGYLSALPAWLLYLSAGLAGLAALLWLAERKSWSREFRFVAVLLYGSVLLTGPAAWAPGRYEHLLRFHLLLDLSAALAFAFAARWIGTRLRASWRPLALVLLLLWSTYPAVRIRAHANEIIRPVAIEQTVEHQMSSWLANNLPEGRVFVTGSIRFYLNAFADLAQFGGGFDPGVMNPNYAKIVHQILQGEGAGAREGEVAALWLKAYGVDAVAVSGPKTRQAYRDFRNPGKFEGVLPEHWRDGDDVLYRVPRRTAGLAHVIRVEDLPGRAPMHGMDLEPVERYVRAIEDPSLPAARFRWLSRHEAEIWAEMRPGQVLSVQVSYHPGWQATANGNKCKVLGDHLGQVVVEPDCVGDCRVTLTYRGGIERSLTRLAALAVALLWAGWWLASALGQRRSGLPA